MDHDTAVEKLLELSLQLMPDQSDETRKRSIRAALACLLTDERHHDDFIGEVIKTAAISAAVDRAFR